MADADKPELDLNELELLLLNSTPGKWKLWGMDVMSDQTGDSDVNKAIPVVRGYGMRTFDTELIAAMQRALPQLLAPARELKNLESAIELLEQKGFRFRGKQELLNLASDLGWKGPTNA